MADSLVRVVKVDRIPTDTYVASDKHFGNLLAELRLVASAQQTGAHEHEVPARLVEVLTALLGPLIAVRDENAQLAREAQERGEATMSVAMELPPAAAEAIETILRLVEEAEGYCARGVLLIPPPSAEIVEFRRWMVAEIGAQLRSPA